MEKRSEKGLECLKAGYRVATARELLRESVGMIFSSSFAVENAIKVKVEISHKREKAVVWKRLMEMEGCVISIEGSSTTLSP